MPDARTAERLRRRTIGFLALERPWLVDEDEHPTRLDPVEAELELALAQRESREEKTNAARAARPISDR